MSKIYCVYCGKENKSDNQNCIECGKKLNPKEHLWRDYIYNHIKDNFKGKVTDNIISLIANYFKSHLYGVFLTIAVIVTAATAIVINNNDGYVKNVTEKPTVILSTEELALDNELVKELYSYNKYNDELYLDAVAEEGSLANDFYENKLVNYDILSNQTKLYITYHKTKLNAKSVTFNSCEELKGYDFVYDKCLEEIKTVSWEDIFLGVVDYYTIDTKAFDTKYKEIFGSDKDIPRGMYRIATTRACEYNNEKKDYLCYMLPEGWASNVTEETKLVKALKVGNTIELYDYFIYIDWDYNTGTYKDKKQTLKISNEPREDLVEQGQLYKHIYKKDINGNYYWYSSEPVNEIN